ncbi:MAG: hypothetical protein HY057_02355 [Rhodospirillales bacterium]|nr:hypothetical protein [Rhodospirillales bacterium]
MDSAVRINDLIAVTGRLITLMNRETELLRAMQADQIGTLQDEKLHLARAYTGLVRDLKRDPEIFTAVERAIKDELSDVMLQFSDAAKANERALRAAREANERVMRAIVDAVNSQRTTAGYSRAGAPVKDPNPARSAPLPIAVDRQF